MHGSPQPRKNTTRTNLEQTVKLLPKSLKIRCLICATFWVSKGLVRTQWLLWGVGGFLASLTQTIALGSFAPPVNLEGIPMTRNQRRKLARCRKNAKSELMLRRALHVLATERTKANLSCPIRGKRTPSGLVSSIYSGAANPLGYTRPLQYTKGAAK